MTTGASSLSVVPDSSKKPEIPTWNGEYQTLRSYKFEVKMYTKGFKKNDRYTCGPNLIRGLRPKPRAFAEMYPSLDEVDKVSSDGACTGWDEFFEFLLEKMNLTSIQDIGEQAENFLLKLKRAHAETGAAWVNRFEKAERELLELLQSLDPDTTKVMADPLKTWWILRRAGLSSAERGQILASTGNKYDYEKVIEALKVQYTTDAAAEHDSKPKKVYGKNYYGAEDEESDGGEADNGYDDEDTLQILALASSGDEDDTFDPEEWNPHSAIYEATEAARNFKTARTILRKLKVARDYYPVVVPKEGEKGRGKGGRKGRGKGYHMKRDYSKMKCLGCGKLGHALFQLRGIAETDCLTELGDVAGKHRVLGDGRGLFDQIVIARVVDITWRVVWGVSVVQRHVAAEEVAVALKM